VEENIVTLHYEERRQIVTIRHGCKKKVKQSRYWPGVAQRVPGS